MSAKRIKAKRWLQNDMTGEIYRSCAPWQKRFAHGVYVLPADAESYERMVSQVARALCHSDNFSPNWATSYSNAARDALRAIGITAPKKGSQ